MSQQKDNLETEAGPEPDTESTAEVPAQEAVAETPQAGDDGDTETDGDDSPALQLLQAQTTIQDYWDQIIRLRAEMENNRKRAERDIENAHKYALKGFVENLLPVIDSMEMGQAAAVADNATLESIREGLELTMNMFVQVLQRNGLEQINPLGEKFDPERHQAISMVEAEGAESNSVVEVMQKGFLLNERLIRPAMVVVSK
jgi:molecular chaperone GrpE